MGTKILRMWVRVLLAVALVLVAQAKPSAAYNNVGTHPEINKYSLDAFIKIKATEANRPDEVLKQYDFKNPRPLTGQTVVAPGDWKQDIRTGDKDLTFAAWIQEGGYTADEPEVQMSLLHFYDPTRSEGNRYLTDIPDLGRYYAAAQRRHLPTLKFWKWFQPRADIPATNPAIDARYWALDGSDSGKSFQNEYSWKRGIEYMEQAFASKDSSDKDRLFAKAWRSLGETMHLLEDMTLPAHVRDDAHPAMAPAGDLRPDPYEKYTSAQVVDEVYAGLPRTESYARLDLGKALDPGLWDQVQSSPDPQALFQTVASYTNRNFFSADTVSGVDHNGKELHSLNGRPDYASPKLQRADFDVDSGTYSKIVAGKKVLMVTEKVVKTKGWRDWIKSILGTQYFGLDTSEDCARSQAQVLIPVAIAGNVKLIDWFVPRVTIQIQSIDPKTKELKGQVVHTPQGAYTKALRFNKGPYTPVRLYVDGISQSAGIPVDIADNRITADLKSLNLKDGASVEIAVDIAGIMVKSAPFRFHGTQPTPTPTRTPVPTPKPTPVGTWMLKEKKAVTADEAVFTHLATDSICSKFTYAVNEGSAIGKAVGTGVINCPREWVQQTETSWTPPPASLTPGQPLGITIKASSSQTGKPGWDSPPQAITSVRVGNEIDSVSAQAGGGTQSKVVDWKVPGGSVGETMVIHVVTIGNHGRYTWRYTYTYQ